jgi:hypothetical protein
MSPITVGPLSPWLEPHPYLRNTQASTIGRVDPGIPVIGTDLAERLADVAEARLLSLLEPWEHHAINRAVEVLGWSAPLTRVTDLDTEAHTCGLSTAILPHAVPRSVGHIPASSETELPCGMP